jgi:hypothetical protein
MYNENVASRVAQALQTSMRSLKSVSVNIGDDLLGASPSVHSQYNESVKGVEFSLY